MVADVLPEERKVGEAEFVGYFLDALRCVAEPVDYVCHDVPLYEGRRGFSRLFLDDGREVFGRHVQAVGIPGDVARAGMGVGDEVGEGFEEAFARREAGRLDVGDAFGRVAEVVEERREQGVGQFAVVASLRVGQLRVEQVVVLQEQAGLFGGEVEHGMVLQEEARVPVVAGQREELVGVGAGHDDAPCAGFGVRIDVIDDGVGPADDEVVGFEGICLPVELYADGAPDAERQHGGVHLHGLVGIEVAGILDEGNHAVVVAEAGKEGVAVEVLKRDFFSHGGGVRVQSKEKSTCRSGWIFRRK